VVEATGVVSGYRAFHRLRPPVVICDLTFQGSGLAGLALIRRMRAIEPETRVLVFSMHNDPVASTTVSIPASSSTRRQPWRTIG
jgi:DNA-binding NarL/FixJ family response regulator